MSLLIYTDTSRLLVVVERGGANHRTVGEDSETIGAGGEHLIDVDVEGYGSFFAGVFYGLGGGVADGGVFVFHGAGLSHYFVGGLEYAGVDFALTGLGGDVTRDAERRYKTSDVFGLLGNLAFFVLSLEGYAGGIKLGGYLNSLGEVLFLFGEGGNLAGGVVILLFDHHVFVAQGLVEPVERIDLQDV